MDTRDRCRSVAIPPLTDSDLPPFTRVQQQLNHTRGPALASGSDVALRHATGIIECRMVLLSSTASAALLLRRVPLRRPNGALAREAVLPACAAVFPDEKTNVFAVGAQTLRDRSELLFRPIAGHCAYTKPRNHVPVRHIAEPHIESLRLGDYKDFMADPVPSARLGLDDEPRNDRVRPTSPQPQTQIIPRRHSVLSWIGHQLGQEIDCCMPICACGET
mmetsp:Transcript_58122/g.125090  ORF Transcript_58122/g.125090 Transcript_58122/m.125090 type:complete len:219 (+) Transcript_58122:525-1181(+)